MYFIPVLLKKVENLSSIIKLLQKTIMYINVDFCKLGIFFFTASTG